MKLLFCTDITENRKNRIREDAPFLVTAAAPEYADALAGARVQFGAALQQAGLPAPLKWASWISGLISLILVGSILEADVTLAEGFRSAAWFYWLCGASLLITLGLFLLKQRRMRNPQTCEAIEQAATRLAHSYENLLWTLGMPADAAEADVLVCRYVRSGDAAKAKTVGMELTAWAHEAKRFSVQAGTLYIADACGKYAIPCSALQRIRTVDRRIAVQFWNKDETFRAPRFKPYKIRQDNYDLYRYRPYHMLEFTCAGEDWALCFPCYELPFFEKLTGLHAE